jgi:hypothetical protein
MPAMPVCASPLVVSSMNIRKLFNARHRKFIMHSMDVRLINIPVPLTGQHCVKTVYVSCVNTAFSSQDVTFTHHSKGLECIQHYFLCCPNRLD